MNDIPDYIHAKARAIARTADSKSSLVKYIERALLAERMAERERCAKIVERMLVFADTTSEADKAISAAIRNQEKP
jgi:hypothetical protein